MFRRGNGHNPIRWDCEKQGCFNLKCRPKIEAFCDCFPGRINFGDVDGLVEIAGHALLLEWKSCLKDLPTGQRVAYEKLSRSGLMSVICLVGDAETMKVTHRMTVFRGRASDWQPCDFAAAKASIKNWVRWAKRNGE